MNVIEIIKAGAAGTLESGDVTVEVRPGNAGIEIDLVSPNMSAFGERIKEVVRETAEGLGVLSAEIRAVDRGALDCTVRARTAAAIYRAAGRDDYSFDVDSIG